MKLKALVTIVKSKTEEISANEEFETKDEKLAKYLIERGFAEKIETEKTSAAGSGGGKDDGKGTDDVSKGNK